MIADALDDGRRAVADGPGKKDRRRVLLVSGVCVDHCVAEAKRFGGVYGVDRGRGDRPAISPQPSNRKRLFQTGGNLSRNSAEPGPPVSQPVAHGPVAGHSPTVATAPITWQYSGTENVPAGSATVDAGTRVADVTVTLGTFNVDATQLGAVGGGAKPKRAAH